MPPRDVVGHFLLVPQSETPRGFSLGLDALRLHELRDRVLPHSEAELTGVSRKLSTGILRGGLRAGILAPGMPANVGEHVRDQLKKLKTSSSLSDTEIAVEMERRRTGGKPIYQQKVSDFFSGEMKTPTLDFLHLLCSALGVSLVQVITAAEQQTALQLNDDWDWIMFGRRLGPERRASTVLAIEGGEPPPGESAPQGRKPSGPRVRYAAYSKGVRK